MVASVIPYTKTVRGVEYFDYNIPESMNVQRGDLVEIPFRSRTIMGLIWTIQHTPSTTTTLKPIGRIISTTLWRDPYRLQLLQWFAEYYCVSLPTAWKTLQFPLPKRPRTVAQQEHQATTALPQLEKNVLSQLHRALQGNTPVVMRWNTDHQRRQLYQTIIKSSHQTLIIVPEYNDSSLLQNGLDCASVRAYQSEPSPSQLLSWSTNEQPEHSVIIGTKKMLSLPLGRFDTIILDHEDSRSHKQFDSNPRYHVRDVLLQYHALRKNVRVILSSAAPSTVTGYGVNELHWPMIDLGTPWTQDIRVVDMEDERTQQNYSWFSEPVRTLLQQRDKTILLFLNRTGTYRASLCRDCGTTVTIDASICTNCGGAHLTKQRKGIATLEEELQHIIPHRTVMRIEKEHHNVSVIPPGSVVISTEKIWRVTSLNVFNAIVVLSVDHLLTYPHFRAHERVYELLIELLRVGRPLVLQTSAPHHPVIRAALANNYQAFLQQELTLRKLLHVPPYGERIRLINTTTGTVETISSCNCAALSPTVTVDRQ